MIVFHECLFKIIIDSLSDVSIEKSHLIINTHVSHFPQTVNKEIEGKCINLYISVI